MEQKFTDWLLEQAPVVVVALGFVFYLIRREYEDRKETKTERKELSDKIDQTQKEKDEALERLYNALTKWQPVIQETVQAVDKNSDEQKEAKKEILQHIKELEKSVGDLRHEIQLLNK